MCLHDIFICTGNEQAMSRRCEILRGGMEQYLTPMGPTKLHVNPIFEIGPLEPRFSEWLVFEGLSVDETGKQHYLDATVAFKRAVLNCIDYLSKFGYTKEQVKGAYFPLESFPSSGLSCMQGAALGTPESAPILCWSGYLVRTCERSLNGVVLMSC